MTPFVRVSGRPYTDFEMKLLSYGVLYIDCPVYMLRYGCWDGPGYYLRKNGKYIFIPRYPTSLR